MSKNPIRPIDAGDLKKYFADDEKLAKQVYIKGSDLIINVKYEYVIELNRCDTHGKILAWADHLCEKNWMNTDVLRRFIHVAAGHHGLQVQVPA